jgi:hypothetical protein
MDRLKRGLVDSNHVVTVQAKPRDTVRFAGSVNVVVGAMLQQVHVAGIKVVLANKYDW